MVKYMLLILWLMIVCVSKKSKRQLMVLMIDGARWDYVERMSNEQLYGFRYFKERGIRVEYVEAIYPTFSYPCWTTLSTGLYAENHGIIGNAMYDKECDQDFVYGQYSTTKLPLWWQDVEPIWTTATRAGLRVATIDWSRSDVPVHGILPLVSSGYGSYKDINVTLQEAFSFIKHGFDLVMVHYDYVDSGGHSSGPNSEEVNFYMMKVGKALETFINQLLNGNIIGNVDIIIVSDHGTTSKCNYPDIDIGKTIDIKRDTTKIINDVTMVGIFAKPGLELHVYNQLKSVTDYFVKLKSEIPERFHYKGSSRAPDILVYAKYKKQDNCHTNNSIHGIDPAEPDMRPMFLAVGKSFRGEGLVHKPINMVDIYQIYCHILGIKSQPHNGSWDNVKFLMASSHDDPQQLQDYLVERKAFTKARDKSINRNSAKSNIFLLQSRAAITLYCILLYFSHLSVSYSI